MAAKSSPKSPTTAEWVESLGLPTTPSAPRVSAFYHEFPRTAEEVAKRVIVLSAVVAVSNGQKPTPYKSWLKKESLWDDVSPNEQVFFADPKNQPPEMLMRFFMRQESLNTLLWALGKVESLGLPTQWCDRKALIALVPRCGDPVAEFLNTANLRRPGTLIA